MTKSLTTRTPDEVRKAVKKSLNNAFGFLMFEPELDKDGEPAFGDAIVAFVPGRVLYQMMLTTTRVERHLGNSKSWEQDWRSLFADRAMFYSYLEQCYLTYGDLYKREGLLFKIHRVSRDANFDYQLWVSGLWNLLKTDAQRNSLQPYPIIQGIDADRALPNCWSFGDEDEIQSLVCFGEMRQEQIEILIENALEYFRDQDEFYCEEFGKKFQKEEDRFRAEMAGA